MVRAVRPRMNRGPDLRQHTAPAWLVWAALWTVYIVWGSTYLAIRVTVETLPPLLTAGIRFLVAGAIVVGFLAVKRGMPAVRVTKRELGSSALVGGLLLCGGNGLVVLAERDVPSSLAALVIASVPLWVVVFRAVTGDRVPFVTLAGVAVGFVGVAILVLPGDQPGGTTLWGLLLLVVASASWATGSFTSTRLALPQDPFLSTGVQMLCGGAWLSVAGLAMGEASAIDAERFSLASILALVYLIIAGSLAAFTAYVWLLQNAPISKVSTYAYVNPVIALVLGWVILDERLTVPMLVGAGVIVASVAFTVTKESGAKMPARGAEAPEPGPALAAAE
jgi:drug/metabolite transporter (DMT)-like permease